MPAPFDFGRAVGSFKTASTALSTFVTPRWPDAARRGSALLGLLRNHPNVLRYGLPVAGGAAAGAGVHAYEAPKGQKLQGALRGAGVGAVTGLGTAAGGHLGEHLGGNMVSMIGGGIPAGLAANALGNAAFKPPVAKTAAASTALARTAQPLVGEIVRRAPLQAKRMPRAAQAGSNLMKYLGAAGAGLGVGGAAGYAAGKSQGGPQKAANALATVPSAATQAVQKAPGMLSKLNPATMAAGAGLGLGAAAGAYNAPEGQKMHGALSGAARVPAQLLGGAAGYIGSAITAPLAGLSHVAKSTLGGARAGGQMMDRLTNAPQAAPVPAKQAGAMGAVAQSVMDKGKQVAGKAENLAKGVANKVVDIGAKAQQGFDKWRKTPNPIVKATSAGGKSAAAMFGETIGRRG